METLADCPARQWLPPSCCYHSFTHSPISLTSFHQKYPLKIFSSTVFIFLHVPPRPSTLHNITPTGLLHLTPFLSFPSMILSSFYTAYSFWITLKMKAPSYSDILVPVYQYTLYHISKTKTFISTTVRTSNSWKRNLLVKVIMLSVLHILMYDS